MRALVIFGWAVALLGAASVAVAQDGLREQGDVALRDGRFADALALFRRAAQESGDPSAWLAVGDAADRLRDDATALEAYEAYLAARPDAPDRVEILARIAVLRRVLARRPRVRLAPDFIPASTILDALRETPAGGLGRRLDAP